MEKIVFSLLGPPGAGKGTLADQIATVHGVYVLSTGALCRRHIALKSDFGLEVACYVQRGIFIPDKLITALVIEEVLLVMQRGVSIILDGFPRTSGQAELFFEFLKKNPLYRFRVIALEIDTKTCEKRLNNRLVCAGRNCQKSFDVEMVQALRCSCGQGLTRRSDDMAKMIIERLKRYPEHKKLLLTYYAQIGQCVELLEIDGLNKSQVFEQFQAII